MASDYLGPDKKNLSEGATAIFVDESGYSLTPFVVRTWAPVGEIPILDHSGSHWRKMSVISGIAIQTPDEELKTRLFFRIHPGKTIKAPEAVDFLRQISYQVEGEVVVIWDRLNVHRSAKVKKFMERNPRFSSVLLPAYSPELNPDEGVWNWSKTKDLANVSAKDSDEMVSRVRGSLMRIQRREHLRRWCLRNSELPWGSLLN